MTADHSAQGARSIIAILGPTAVGKSGIALELARRLDAEIVNCDALQVYRGLDIGTAKPSVEERAAVPHHLYDILAPHERFSAGAYARRAQRVLEDVLARRTAILVGGTGLYYRALTRGIADIPPIPEEVRADVRARMESEGPVAMHEELARLDPAAARTIRTGDRQRIGRALEIVLATGRTQGEWIAEQPVPRLPAPVHGFALTMDRDLLYHRIRQRTRTMFDEGWVDEVRTLLDEGVDPGAPAFQAIGYREIVELVRGGATSAEALDRILVSTRRYAKRQLTWFRKEQGVQMTSADDSRQTLDHVLSAIS